VSSFTDQMTVACSTKRSEIVDGQGEDPALEIPGLFCMPIMPVDAELASRAGLNTPLEIWQTFIEGNPDIVQGDILTIGSQDYDIRAVWDYGGWDGLADEDDDWKLLVLEEVKSS